ncbi:MAG TPA: aldo/keto reductase [Vicinamibacterales bacterium]|nr:aldo/keto reductase [Vicinamibacterales bacterium]
MTRTTLTQGYDISRVLKGGWQLAGGHGAVDEAAALADMDRYVEAGITTFDCADIYTGVEALIGQWRRTRPNLAATVQVHTKYVPDRDRLPVHSRGDVVRGVDRSLQRLGADALDVVQLHWWDYDVPGYVEAALWLNELRLAGKVRHIGLTNFDQQRLEEFVAAGVPLVSHQVQYSVLDRRPAAMKAFCASHAIGLLCYGALAGGFLSERWLGAAAPEDALENRSLIKYRLIIDEFGGWPLFQQMLETLETIGARHRAGIGAVAMRWVLDQPGVAGIIVGVRHAGHLASIESALAMKLDSSDRAAIEEAQARANGPTGEVYGLERIKGGAHASIMRYSLNRE